ncbi:hypothetical protein HOP50_13g69640 [Chloropicon primus]|uniref:Uncharacterized protein n=1 Tax=Chloropicon primus TaxID=1764295 RepID=A0A5B8MW09_9CHLO|nr:hypothetical protein A3770_13p69440 [Chloropicon primus]UPR03634.1 hypothetical protein HOP50_13g69640 [Chloropicon primus]|eukprot:QDZ24426.1 hypothetical protein A3770_13p69440 [Chloropicon primus]
MSVANTATTTTVVMRNDQQLFKCSNPHTQVRHPECASPQSILCRRLDGCCPFHSSTSSGCHKRSLSESRSSDTAASEVDSERVASTSSRMAPRVRLHLRCKRVLRNLDLELRVAESLSLAREVKLSRQDLALKAKRVYKSKGINMLVVLMALKWKHEALGLPLNPDEMAQTVKARTHVYLRNQVYAAIREHSPSVRMT